MNVVIASSVFLAFLQRASSTLDLLQDLEGSGKCLGGRCVLVLPNDHSDHEIDAISAMLDSKIKRNSIHQTTPGHVLEFLQAGNSNLVMVWSSLEDLFLFLKLANSEDSGKGEHYVEIDDVSMAGLKESDVALRFDAKVFFVLSDGMGVYETFGLTTSTTKTKFRTQLACNVWPCNSMKDIWLRRSDLSGIDLVVGFIHTAPYAMSAPGHNSMGVSGYFPDLFQVIKSKMNFTTTVVQTRGYGRMFKNGSFTGIVGMLQRKEIDVNIGSQSLRYDRMMANDITQPLLSSPWVIFFKSTGQYKLSMWQLLAVFNMDAWMIYLGILIICLIILAYLLMIKRDPMNFCGCLYESIAFVSRVAILRNYNISILLSHSIKVLCVVVSLLCFVFFTYFRAGLLSKLAVRSVAKEMEGLSDILESHKKVMMIPGGNIQATFTNAPRDSILGKIWRQNIKPFKETTLQNLRGAKALDFIYENEDHVAMELQSIGHQANKHPCEIKELREQVSSVDQVIAFQQNWPMTEMFNYFFSQMRADGVVKKIHDRYFKDPNQDCSADTDPVLNYDTLFGIFAVIIAGVALSLIIVACEVVSRRGRAAKAHRSASIVAEVNSKTPSEREEMQNELQRLRKKLKEQDEIIRMMKNVSIYDVEGFKEH